MKPINFYTYKDGTKTEMCKKCLTLHIDNFDPSTFLWLLEKMDVPYIEREWNDLRDKAFAKDPYKMNGMSVFGKYLSKMRLQQWVNPETGKPYTWADTQKLRVKAMQREEIEKKKREEKAKEEVDLKAKLEAGEISEAEYKTRVSIDTQYKEMLATPFVAPPPPPPPPPLVPPPLPQSIPPSFTPDPKPEPQKGYPQDVLIGANNPYNENNFVDESELVDLGAELTKEDKIYLAMKWGRLYKANEWVELERKYNEMMESFDIQDSDTIGTLILICKTYLKMNQSIDCGDMDGYQKLSRVYDALRKSSKFTAAQNKDQNTDFLDSVGELVAYCEQNGGAIPKYEIKVDLDIVDKVIRDLKEYNRSLIDEDPALSSQIEDYIKKREIAEQMRKEKEEAKQQGLDVVPITDEDHIQHLQMLADYAEQDQQEYFDNTIEKEKE